MIVTCKRITCTDTNVYNILDISVQSYVSSNHHDADSHFDKANAMVSTSRMYIVQTHKG